jgi:hypothetical protein
MHKLIKKAIDIYVSSNPDLHSLNDEQLTMTSLHKIVERENEAYTTFTENSINSGSI